MFSRIASAALLSLIFASWQVQAADVRPAAQGATAARELTRAPKIPVSATVFEPVTSTFLTAAFGGAALGAQPESSALLRASGMSSPRDFAASYKASLFGNSRLGVFGGYNSRANLFESAPTTGWNFGATVGYAGFYLRAGLSSDANQNSARLVNDVNRGWLAGFGYEFGSFDVRVTYMNAESVGLANVNEPDNRMWMIGGIYQLTPRVRVNADAFTGGRDMRSTANVVTAPSQTVAPQGTGARVGVQLKF